jgi:hypothetical protein
MMSENRSQKRKFLIRGVSKKQLQQIKNGKLPLSFFIGFVSGINISAFIPNGSDKSSANIDEDNENNSEDLKEDTTEECIDIEIPTTMEFASGINDEMSFKEAYEAARNEVGDEGFFNWKGNSYHTLTKEEWDSLSEEDRALISERIQENSSFEFTKVIDDEMNENSDEFEFDEDDNENEDEEIQDDEEIEEITIDDLIPDEGDNEDYEYVELDDFAETDDIIAGLNDGEAEEDEFNSAENIADHSQTDDFLKKINDFENNNEDPDDFA